MILDILDLQSESWGIKAENINGSSNNKNISYTKKNGRRKSSINPKDVEYIRRSRFNSIADELKTSKIEDSSLLLNELIESLGADIEFYQCFRLTEEEFVNINYKKYFYLFSQL